MPGLPTSGSASAATLLSPAILPGAARRGRNAVDGDGRGTARPWEAVGPLLGEPRPAVGPGAPVVWLRATSAGADSAVGDLRGCVRVRLAALLVDPLGKRDREAGDATDPRRARGANATMGLGGADRGTRLRDQR